MAALDLTSLTDAHSIVVARSGLEPVDLDNLLEESAATFTDETDTEVTVFRPWYVSAALLKSNLNTKKLKGAEGAIFSDPQTTINGLMREQAAFDASRSDTYDDYTVPEGYEASTGTSLSAVF